MYIYANNKGMLAYMSKMETSKLL